MSVDLCKFTAYIINNSQISAPNATNIGGNWQKINFTCTLYSKLPEIVIEPRYQFMISLFCRIYRHFFHGNKYTCEDFENVAKWIQTEFWMIIGKDAALPSHQEIVIDYRGIGTSG